MFRKRGCVQKKRLCSEKEVVFRKRGCVQKKRLCSEKEVLFRKSSCVQKKKLCSEFDLIWCRLYNVLYVHCGGVVLFEVKFFAASTKCLSLLSPSFRLRRHGFAVPLPFSSSFLLLYITVCYRPRSSYKRYRPSPKLHISYLNPHTSTTHAVHIVTEDCFDHIPSSIFL